MPLKKRVKRDIDKPQGSEAYQRPTMYEGTDVKLKAEELAKKVIEDFNTASKARSERESKWESNLKQYRGDIPEKTKPWKNCSNMHIPMTEIVVDTYHANFMRSFFSSPEFVDVKPTSADDVMTADKRKQFLNYQLTNEVDIQKVMDKILEVSLIYGDCITKIRYCVDTQVTKERITQQVADEAGQMTEQEVFVDNEAVIYDAPKIDVPNIDDIYKAPHSIGLQKMDCEYVMHRSYLTRAEYMDRVESAGFTKIDFEKLTQASEVQTSRIDDKLKTYSGLEQKTLRDTKNEVMLLEWYGTFYNDKTNSYQEIVAIIHPGSRTVCKAFVNPWGFRPFIQFSPFPIANNAYGRGLPEKLRFLQAQLNTIYNQRNDAAAKRIMSPGFYRAGSSFDPQQYILEPNGMYPIDSTSDIYFPQLPDSPASQYQEESMLWRYMEQLTAASENVQGIGSKGDQTATEVAALSERGTIRFELMYRRYESALLEVIVMISRMNQLYMPSEKEYRVLGSDGRFKWTSITKQEMNGKLDLVLQGSSIMESRAKAAKAQLLYNAGMMNPIVVSNQRAVYELSKYFFSMVGGKDINIDRILPRPPQAATRTPEEEHDLLYQGKMVMPDIREDAQYHQVTHDGEINQPEFQTLNPQVQMMFLQHLDQTKALVAAQMQMQQMGAFGQIGSAPVQPGQNQAAPQAGQGKIQGGKPQQVNGQQSL